ncbi:HNH endonuclease [Leucobacter japonicus]|uniref:HNH endonuclease n=1 Tax=Leucobacter japonicus TaxID=1461259 RepID=UPI000949971B|nr:HNH endonuclease signature motif containing protein [Leucobacter japonicus]
MITIGDAVDELLAGLTGWEAERYPVRNREERTILDPQMWHLLFERDGSRCWMCHCQVERGAAEIDHLVPRSSFVPANVGMADRSWNLRVACVACNQAKSNFTVSMLPRTVGVTKCCWDCSNNEGSTDLTEPAFCGRCGVVSRVPDRSWIL